LKHSAFFYAEISEEALTWSRPCSLNRARIIRLSSGLPSSFSFNLLDVSCNGCAIDIILF
ncbi:hypothetical protein, partial [Niallia circulans]|uniref:hypothetical protein n=1 Tax=Niallia circulans TaxID=1397 RepID=UPI001C2532CD